MHGSMSIKFVQCALLGTASYVLKIFFLDTSIRKVIYSSKCV